MNRQLKAIEEIHRFFAKEKILYVLIGGIALQYWGQPRFTRDIDVTIFVNPEKEVEVIKKIFSAFSPRIKDAIQFALKNRICLVRSRNGYEIDIALGIPGYEELVIKRAVKCQIGKVSVKICSAEDLIIHKMITGRPQDLFDIEGIIMRQGRNLNLRYIRKWLREFSNIVGMSELIGGFEGLWKKIIKR